MKKIKSLTKEQEIKLEEFRKEWLEIGLSTKRVDKETTVRVISKMYSMIDKSAPEFVFCDSIMDAQKQISKRKGESKPEYEATNLWGSLDVYWIAYYLFPHKVLRPIHSDEEMERLNLWADLAKSCFWWHPFEKVCFVSDRPTLIKRDDRGLLHNETGPALEFIDGYSLYSWHGVTIPSDWIKNKEELTPSIALQWDNVEQRRAACEILGWDKVLEHPSLNPKVIDEDQPHIGSLIQVDLPDAKGQWFLKYRCGTGRWFAEAVNDKSYNTALKANAGGNGWREGKGNPHDFIPFVRT